MLLLKRLRTQCNHPAQGLTARPSDAPATIVETCSRRRGPLESVQGVCAGSVQAVQGVCRACAGSGVSWAAATCDGSVGEPGGFGPSRGAKAPSEECLPSAGGAERDLDGDRDYVEAVTKIAAKRQRRLCLTSRRTAPLSRACRDQVR